MHALVFDDEKPRCQQRVRTPGLQSSIQAGTKCQIRALAPASVSIKCRYCNLALILPMEQGAYQRHVPR